MPILKTAPSLPALETLIDLLRYRGQNQPQKTGYIFLENGEIETEKLTYQELDQQAQAIASSLQNLNQRQDRILLLYPPGLEIIAAVFGCLYAGAIAVPIPCPRTRIHYAKITAIVEDAQISTVLTTTALFTEIRTKLAKYPFLSTLNWITTDTISLNTATSWQKPTLDRQTIAIIQYKCGSTGPPQGIALSHQNLLHCERLMQMGFGHTEKTILVGWLPLFHDMGLVENLLQPLYLGIPAILLPPAAFLEKPLRWLRAISRYQATTSGGPNFVYDLCTRKISASQCQDLDLSRWEIAFNSSQTIQPQTLERFTEKFSPYGFRRQTFYPCYGKAETTLFICGGLKTAPPVLYHIDSQALAQQRVEPVTSDRQNVRTLVGSGQTFFDKIFIVDPKAKTRCLGDQVGEIWIKGSSVAQGYWNRPELTQNTFQAYLADTGEGPFLRTGDLGFFAQGELFVTSRLPRFPSSSITNLDLFSPKIMENQQNKSPRLANSVSPAIAIVGMSSLFPEAKTVGEFWDNILSRRDCIREIVDGDPREFDGYWRLDEYYDASPTAIDKTYGKTGGFIPEIDFDPIEFGIPPIHLESISTTQLFSLVVAKQALADAGYDRNGTSRLNRERTGVVLGMGGCGNIAFTLATRTNLPQWEKVLRNLGFPEELVQATLEKLTNLYAGWRESSFPGLLGNVVSGRIASYFDLGGTNCTLDAACASSLAAFKMAIAELADGSCDAVLTGGVNVDNSILAYMCFSKTPALSPAGYSRPFDATSDGIVLGDGIGMLVLKRLEDAVADGNKIYGVIRGMGSSSDGRAKSIYAPRFEGQIQALNRAYQRAGISPQQIQLVEAHGTGTVAGDLCEIKSITSVYQKEQVAPGSVALGSVKSQIGHTRIAAGAASLIKVALGLYHKILPPTINITQPHPQLALDNSCFYLNTEARPWIAPPTGDKRRAAISSFGFGGTNFHMIVEEYESEHQGNYRLHSLPEIFIVQGQDTQTLRQNCAELLAQLQSATGKNHYRQYCNQPQAISPEFARLGFVSESLAQAIEYLQLAVNWLAGEMPAVAQHPQGIYYRYKGFDATGKVVALFPGQGSQYPGMGRDWANNYPEVRTTLAAMDRLFSQQNRPLLSNLLYPPDSFDSEQQQKPKKELTKTENAQPAIGAISAGIYQLLQKAGLKPDFILGHSFGEFTALWAAGVISDQAFYQLAIDRGQAMQLSGLDGSAGVMLAVNANETVLQPFLAAFTDVTITNYNARSQTVVGGSHKSITGLQEKLTQAGIKATVLPVANAFHTDFVKAAAGPLAAKILQTNFTSPTIPIYSNVTAQPYPENPAQIQQILAEHLLSPVAFKQSIEAIYQQGGRIFLEIGPKNVLTTFVKDILQDREHIAVALDPQSRYGSEYELRRAVLQLRIAGVSLEAFDPYGQPQPVEAEKSRPSLPIKLNGGFYLNPDTKELRQKALVEKDTKIWDQLWQSYRTSLEEPTLPPVVAPGSCADCQGPHSLVNSDSSIPLANNSSKTMVNNHLEIPSDLTVTATVSDRIESQNLISTIHQQFHQNQSQSLNLLAKIVDHQNLVLEKHHNSPELSQVMQNLDKILQLLQVNVNYLNNHHEHYLQTQLALLQGNLPPVNSFPSPSLPSIAEITVNSSEPDNGHGSHPEPQKPVTPSLSLVVLSTGTIAKPTVVEKPVAVAPVFTGVALTSAATAVIEKPVTMAPVALVEEEPVAIAPLAPTVAPISQPSVSKQVVEEISATLLKIVSDKTGYPAEMLDLNMDLEADMGIDSIKQMEIIGAMHEAYPQIDMDADTIGETLAELRTLAQVVDYLSQSLAGQTQPATVTVDHGETEVAAPVSADMLVSNDNHAQADEISATLLKIVSDKTGYPAEMLDLNMDLEADMGIDSIKQMEIIGAMHEAYPQIDMDADTIGETLAELRTLAQVVDYLHTAINSVASLLTVDGITRQVVKKNA